MTFQRPAIACILASLLVLSNTAAVAQAPAADKAADPKAEARVHFEKGILLFDEEAWDAALAEFLRSRSIHPGRAATKNAAICLRKLRRYDEALDMFEELAKIVELPTADRDLATREIKALKGLVGNIDVKGAEAGSVIVIDGRDRGTAPAPAPIRVPAGTHVVRVYKEGFEAFETRVDVAGGQSVPVQTRMSALSQAGRMKVTEQNGKVLDVVIDNVVVGKTPWDGSLAPGDHTVLLRGEGDIGTQPASAPVRLNQVTPLTLFAEPLGAHLRIAPEPAGATIAIDGVSVGRGLWDGRLREGAHRVEVAAEGFLPQSQEVKLASGKSAAVNVKLERDPTSPLWNENRGAFYVEIDGNFGITPSLGGDVAGACSAPCSRSLGMGFLALGRGGYRFSSGFMLGVDAGYLLVKQDAEGRKTSVQPTGLAANPGTADDALTLGGLMLGASAGLRLGSSFPLTFRLGTGVLIGSVNDHRTGNFSTVARAGRAAVAYEVDAEQSPSAAFLYVAPEARFGVKLGKHFELSAGIEAVVLIAVSQPKWEPNGQLVNAATDGQGTFPGDALTGKALVVLAPGLAGRYEF